MRIIIVDKKDKVIGAKERFHKYHGIKKNNYPFYLKEMEFRFNHKNENVFNLLFDIAIRRLV